MKRLTVLISLLGLLVAGAASAAGMAHPPYNPKADAKVEVSQALAQARANHKPVLLFFGANWCPDCRALARDVSQGRSARLLHGHFNVAKIDVGNFDKNLDVVKRFGNPIKKGIPAAVIVSPQGKVLFSTRAGELSNARHMSQDGVYDFFAKAIEDVHHKG